MVSSICDIAAVEGSLGEAGLFERGLHIHSVVDDVGDELRVGLRLVPAAHNAEADVDIALLHEGRDDGVKRAFVSGERVGQARSEVENLRRGSGRRSRGRGDEAGAVAGVVALDQRDDVAVLVDGGEIDGRVAVVVELLPRSSRE